MTLEETVQRFRSGDSSVRDELIISLIPTALTIASRVSRKNPRRADDLISTALYHLVLSVDAFPAVGIDNNIAAYVAKRVKCETLSCLSEHSVVKKRTLFRKLKKGEIVESIFEILESDRVVDDCQYDTDKRDFIEVMFNKEEIKILQYRLDGYTNEEIAKIVNVSESYVQNRVQEIQRVLKYWCSSKR